MCAFDNIFDFNHDGKLDTFEQAAEFSFVMGMMEEEEKMQAEKEASLDFGSDGDTDLDLDDLDDLDGDDF